MLLTILIPTYNRAKDLDYNISLLEQYIGENNLKDKVSILISNNFSQDDTVEVVKEHVAKGIAKIDFYSQETNIGLEANILFCLKKAASEYVVFLGDDDYLEEGYLLDCVRYLKEDETIGCITPNYSAFLPDKETFLFTREPNAKDCYYLAGFDACLGNAWRAHSLSGLCFRREGVYEEYVKCKVHNLYPQIFFVAYCCMRYNCVHLGNPYVHVTNVPQANKDWGYGDDGLCADVFDNFKKIGVSCKERAKLEYDFIYRHPYRYNMYPTIDGRNKAIEKIILGKNTSFLGKYYISLLIVSRRHYTGKKIRLLMYFYSIISLTKKMFLGEQLYI